MASEHCDALYPDTFFAKQNFEWKMESVVLKGGIWTLSQLTAVLTHLLLKRILSTKLETVVQHTLALWRWCIKGVVDKKLLVNNSRAAGEILVFFNKGTDSTTQRGVSFIFEINTNLKLNCWNKRNRCKGLSFHLKSGARANSKQLWIVEHRILVLQSPPVFLLRKYKK